MNQERDKRSKKDFIYNEDETHRRSGNKAGKFIRPEKKVEAAVEEQIKTITIPEKLTIRELAEAMHMNPSEIIKKLFLAGQIMTPNSEVEYDEAEKNIDEDLDEEKEDISDYKKMELMIEKARESAETEGIDCSETQYYAAFIYKLCCEEDEDLEASIMTLEDEDGTTHAWVEVCLDGKWYKVDASKEKDQITEFSQDSTDVEGDVAESTEKEMNEGAAAADEEANENIDGIEASVASDGDCDELGGDADGSDADASEDAEDAE